MPKKDQGHDETEEVLRKLEARINKEYAQAEKELQAKLDDYIRRFKIKDELKQKAVENGLITQAEYKQWLIGQLAMGKRWEEMRDTIAQDLANTAQIAQSITNGYMPEVYAINHNYGTFQVEKEAKVDTSYTLYDRDTVERLFHDDVKFYKGPGRKLQREINMGKQLAWDKKEVQSAMLQGILQGESIGKIATRLSNLVGDADRKAAIRNARTMTTGVENAGRIESYKRAEGMGIEMEQEWLATLDGRTRHEHRMLDGQRVPVGEKFEVDGYEIAYPGDPEAEGFLVYNCRCTLVCALKGFAPDASDLSLRNTKHMEEETYEEWKESHNIHSDPITKQDDIEETMKKIYGVEYARYNQDNDLMHMASYGDNDWSKTDIIHHDNKEIESITEYAEKKGVKLQGLKEFDGNTELLKSEIDTVAKLKEDLPLKRGMSLSVKVLDDADFGVTYGRGLSINTKALRDKDITEENMGKIPEEYKGIITGDNRYLAGEKIEDIVAHEYGHVFCNSYNVSGRNAIDLVKEVIYNLDNKEINDEQAMIYLLDNVSYYATVPVIRMIDGREVEIPGGEITSEILSRHNSNPTEFTEAYIEALKRRVGL